MAEIEVYFLGTNGWFTTHTGNTVSVLLKTKDYSIICDAGEGLQYLDEYADQTKPAFLFLSHFHIDHIVGLHLLNKFHFKKGLKIITYPGGAGILKTFIHQPFTISWEDLPFDVELVEIERGRHAQFPFGLVSEDLEHSSRCFGYRFEINGKTITFCTDTGRCDGMLKLSDKADLLITECAYKSGQENAGWPHLNPEKAAQIAKDANVKQLVLTHFDAQLYKTKQDRLDAQKVAKKIFLNTLAAEDRMSLQV